MSKYRDMSDAEFDMSSYDAEEISVDMALSDLHERITADQMIDGD